MSQYKKDNILSKLKLKAIAAGFNLDVDKSKLPPGCPTLLDQLTLIAETIDEALGEDKLPAELHGATIAIGPTGAQSSIAYKDGFVKADMTTDPQFFAWMEMLHGILQGAYPEPGYGSPDTFATALKILLSNKPTSITAKITSGSSTVKVSI